MYGAMDEVTSKIAYAYAKQQAFVALALAMLVGGVAAAAEGHSALVVLAPAAAVVAGASVILILAATRTNLAAITRPGLRIVGGLFLVTLAAWVAQAFLGGVAAAPGALLLGLVLLLAAGAVSYPLPIRRGGTVLYTPAAIRDLADARSSAMSAIAVASFGLSRLLLPSSFPSPNGPALSGILLGAVLVGVGAAAVGVLAALPSGTRRTRGLEAILAVAVVLALLGMVGRTGEADAWGSALVPTITALSGIAVTRGLSARLNHGKTIVARRA